MDLCDEIYKCLQLLKDDQVITNEDLNELIKLVCKQLNDNSDELKINELDFNRKKLFIAIYCLYLETCRLNTTLNLELNELRTVLDNVNILESNKKLIIDTYETADFRSTLINKLNKIKLECKQQFIDQFKTVELTKDSVVKSSKKTDYRHICQTEYLMNLQTETTKHLFTCSIQDIESMSVKFKEIMKTVDNLFTVFKK